MNRLFSLRPNWLPTAGNRLYLSVAVALCLAPGYLAAQQEEEAAERLTVSILEGRGKSLSAYPYAYYTPETELAIGAGGIITFYTSQIDTELRPSKVSLSAYYSTRRQFKISGETQLYYDRNRSLVVVPFSVGSFVDKYWGVGNQSLDIPNVDYAVQVIEGSIVLEGITGLGGFSRNGFVYRGSYTNITDVRDNPNLTDSTVGLEGGFTSGVGFDLVRDTRDAVFYPTQGGFHRLYFVWYTSVFGSQYRFNQLEVDFRRYLPMSPTQVLAFQISGEMVFGDAPFYDLPALGGGGIMRGYYEGRYRDVNVLAAQAEIRQHIWRRLGAVAFAGVGEAFGSDQSDLSISRLKYSLGGGLRFVFYKAQRINLRMDLGFGKNSHGIYFGLEEAF